MDKYGYIGIETLLNYCENSKDHAVTPNDFMRMKRVRVPERNGGWVNRKLIYSDISIATCTICGKRVPVGNFCMNCGNYKGAKMGEGGQIENN